MIVAPASGPALEPASFHSAVVDALCPHAPSTRHRRGGQVQRGELVGRQTRVGQLVALPGNAIAGQTLGLEGIDRLHHQRHAHLAQEVLVPLEVAPEGIASSSA